MQRCYTHSIAPFATVTMMLVFAAFTGCEKKPEVYTTRSADPAYTQSLKETAKKQDSIKVTRARIASQIAELEARARAALPKDATNEQVLEELRSNPKKYPGFAMLWDALEANDRDLAKENANARDLVRQRILKETADKKAVNEGRAKAVESAAKN